MFTPTCSHKASACHHVLLQDFWASPRDLTHKLSPAGHRLPSRGSSRAPCGEGALLPHGVLKGLLLSHGPMEFVVEQALDESPQGSGVPGVNAAPGAPFSVCVLIAAPRQGRTRGSLFLAWGELPPRRLSSSWNRLLSS